MVEVLEKYYEKFFQSNSNNFFNNFLLVEKYLKRYNYTITNLKLDGEEKILYLDIAINNEDGCYSSVYGVIEMAEDEIYLEVNKELFNGECCIYEHLDITNNSFNGNICDFGFYNANVVLVENSKRQERYGEICETVFDQNGIIDNNTYIPYDSNSYDGIINEVMEIHELNKEEIAEKYDFDDYCVQSLIVHGENDNDINNYVDFSKIFNNKIYRGRRR
ncbi:MAG: hypothetical protein IKN87_01585 [Bacilli bacterium]|nr:hypothetical protein [Bacilli bacterium]